MSIETLYQKFRKHSPFMLVGANAQLALDAAKTLQVWNDLENSGLVQITTEPDDMPDDSFFDTWPHLSDQSKRRLKAEYHGTVCGIVVRCRADDQSLWVVAYSIWGNAGYSDATSPFENAYVINLMQSAIDHLHGERFNAIPQL